MLKVVLGSCVETVPVGLTRTDGKSLHLLSVGKVNHVVLYLFIYGGISVFPLLVLVLQICRQMRTCSLSPDLGSSIGCI